MSPSGRIPVWGERLRGTVQELMGVPRKHSVAETFSHTTISVGEFGFRHELPVRGVAQVRQLSGVHLPCVHHRETGEFDPKAKLAPSLGADPADRHASRRLCKA